MELRAALEQLDAAAPGPEEAAAVLGFAAASELPLDDTALAGPLRRALLLLAAGGDPQRELDPDGRAVRALADELAELVPASAVAQAFARVRSHARGLARLEPLAAELEADSAAARTALALALLGSELTDADA
ncbi:MAG: hypothetical protein ACM33B_06805 [Pseudomonadota bacterium]